ncbi:MAG: hypothetical protein LBJ47_06365, partial [Tannerella sp.]|nr:hypothetical protein [Tannerella sp.]
MVLFRIMEFCTNLLCGFDLLKFRGVTCDSSISFLFTRVCLKSRVPVIATWMASGCDLAITKKRDCFESRVSSSSLLKPSGSSPVSGLLHFV